MKKRYLIITMGLLFVLVATLFVSFAWWTNGIRDNDISFSSAKISSEMVFYNSTDFDLDGIFDFETGFQEEKKYNELSEEKIVHIQIDDFRPSEVHTYQMRVMNCGDVDGYVVLILNKALFQNTDPSISNMIKCLSMSIWDGTQYIDKCYLGNLTESNLIILGGKVSDIVKHNEDESNPIYRNFIFTIEFETEANLLLQGIEISNYQNLQNQSLNIDLFEFVLSSQTYR